MASRATWLLRASDWLYRRVMMVYPALFRQSYGAAMAHLFRDCCRAAYDRAGVCGVIGLWWRTLGDLVHSAAIEQVEHWRAMRSQRTRQIHDLSRNRRLNMAHAPHNEHAFAERLAQVLGHDPSYYQLLIADEPSRRVWDLVDSLALEGDPAHPATVLHLFQVLSDSVPEDQIEHWLAGLRDTAQHLAHTTPLSPQATVTAHLMQIITADPSLYNLVASAEPGYGLLELVESLALEGDVADVEAMLRLMQQLAI